MTSTRRPAGRPRTQILSRKIITSAAQRLIVSEGIQAMTMTSLANELSVTPSALYNHAESKHEILRWIEDSIISEVDITAFDEEPWLDALEKWVFSYRAVLVAHHDLLAPGSHGAVHESPNAVRMYERVTSSLIKGGWPLEACIPLITALEAMTFGASINDKVPVEEYRPEHFSENAPNFGAALSVRNGLDLRDLNEQLFKVGFDSTLAWFAKQHGVPLPEQERDTEAALD